jgi:NAD(P)-dependent dehydrogenase (short-subunit alcohol dehydrogenase family)
MIDVNLNPVFLITQAVLPNMRAKKGRITPYAALDTDLPRRLPHHWWMRLPRCTRFRLLLSNGAYGDIMPRVVGLFMFVLGGVIVQFVT